ncbi:MAG: DUF3015 family protein [Pseudobacteriovorax sp.]|nr:DUF3015 family protein [Pseudobacteriovorax sp.]
MKLFLRFAPLLFLFTIPPESFAAPGYGMAGCGLGSIVMGNRGGQVSAATTNGSFTSQGFGITSGTSNCLTDDMMAAVNAQEKFVVDNLKILSKEMAQGQGETLDNFAYTFGCSKSSLPEFSVQMQSSYQEIFSSPGAMAILSEVRHQIKSNTALKSSCTKTI